MFVFDLKSFSLIFSAITSAPTISIIINIKPVTAVIAILIPTSEESTSIIERQIFSVKTDVKKGINAVIRSIVFLEVQTVAKLEIPAKNKNSGIKMLENP